MVFGMKSDTDVSIVGCRRLVKKMVVRASASAMKLGRHEGEPREDEARDKEMRQSS